MKLEPSAIGSVFQTDDYFVFFGNKSFNTNDTALNENLFILGHQTHEAELQTVSKSKAKGSFSFINSSDGLMTTEKNRRLSIITADCVPCFIITQTQIFSLHLGWRSLQKGLLDKALKLCAGPFSIFIGPHIRKNSFEVQSDTFEPLKEYYASENPDWFEKTSSGGYLVSLEYIIKHKVSTFEHFFHSVKINTFTDNAYYSYRRDNNTKGRNLSFAFRKIKV